MAQLRDATLKVSRAQHHLNALKENIGTIVKPNIHAIRMEFDPKQGKHIIYAKRTQPIPALWSLMIGDLVHNARSALDVAVYSLSTLAPDDKARFSLQYPIFHDAKNYAGRADGFLKGVPAAQRAIIDATQPCNAGFGDDDLLGLLADINNTDKHRLIHVVEIPSRIEGISIVGPGKFGSNVIIGKGAMINVGHGAGIDTSEFAIHSYLGVTITQAETAIGEIRNSTESKVNVKFDLTGEIQFGSGGRRVQGRNVVRTLGSIVDYIEKLVELLKA